jgi:predicted methyltransferase
MVKYAGVEGEADMKNRVVLFVSVLVLAAAPAIAQDYGAILAAPDRSEADRNTDKARKSDLFLPFIAVKSGMKVLDVASGGGYTTELLARAVGPSGKVYAQDAPTASERARNAYDARVKTPAMAGVERVLRPYDDPIPPGVRDLDMITLYYNYHDFTFMPVDRAAMNKKLFDALKPGGTLIVADHSAAAGAGTSVAQTLHRVEESALQKEVEAAGFKLAASGDFLRNPDDKRDARVFGLNPPADSFIHKYEKPR